MILVYLTQAYDCLGSVNQYSFQKALKINYQANSHARFLDMSNLKPKSMDNLSVQLQQLCQEKSSGTLFISGDNRGTAQINLLDGNIMALSCLNKRGMEALLLIQQFNVSWFQFIKGGSITTDSDLPPTEDILDSLVGRSTSTSASSELTINTQQSEKVLKEILTDFMGPVGPMICNKVFRQTQNLETAIELLALEIPNHQQAIQFKEKARQQILFLKSSSNTAPSVESHEKSANIVFEIIPHKTRTVLKETLADFMGPVAQMVCNKVLRQARNLDSA